MKKEKIITLDLTGCKYLGELHQRIKKAFDFPDFYGENWSAFDDLLWSESDADKVIVLGEKAVSEELRPSVKMIYKILKEFQEHCAKYDEQVEIEIHR